MKAPPESRLLILLSYNQPTANDQVILVKNRRLAGSDSLSWLKAGYDRPLSINIHTCGNKCTSVADSNLGLEAGRRWFT